MINQDDIHIFRKGTNEFWKGKLVERSIGKEVESAVYLQFELETAQTGTLFLYGTTTETVSFSNSKFGLSENSYSSLDGITPSSLTGTVTMTATNSSGETILEDLKFIKTVKGTYTSKTTGQYFKLYGMDQNFSGIVNFDGDTDIRLHDFIKIERLDTDEHFEVDLIVEPRFMGQAQHKQAILKRTKA